MLQLHYENIWLKTENIAELCCARNEPGQTYLRNKDTEAVLLQFIHVHVHACVRAQASYSVREYSLPELGDWGSKVSNIGRQPEGLVLAYRVLHTVFCVPRLLAFRPRKLGLKALKEVVESPGQDHDVVDVQKRDDHDRSVADTCRIFKEAFPY